MFGKVCLTFGQNLENLQKSLHFVVENLEENHQKH